MLACVSIPGFALRAALRLRPGRARRPAALAPVPGTEPLLGPVTAAAEAAGVRPGMRLGEALATCPELVLVEQDPAAAEQAWEEILRMAANINADIIVMGTHGRDGLERALIGSQTEKVVRKAPCTVVCVKEKDPYFVMP